MLKLITYDTLLAQASEYILSLPETKQKELKENLSHGKALLRSRDQMYAYLHYYGQIHREKLIRAFKHIPSDFLKSPFSVIDWGCGQGLASMVLNDYILDQDIITDFTQSNLLEDVCYRRKPISRGAIRRVWWI